MVGHGFNENEEHFHYVKKYYENQPPELQGKSHSILRFIDDINRKWACVHALALLRQHILDTGMSANGFLSWVALQEQETWSASKEAQRLFDEKFWCEPRAEHGQFSPSSSGSSLSTLLCMKGVACRVGVELVARVLSSEKNRRAQAVLSAKEPKYLDEQFTVLSEALYLHETAGRQATSSLLCTLLECLALLLPRYTVTISSFLVILPAKKYFQMSVSTGGSS